MRMTDMAGKRFGALVVTGLAPRDLWRYGRTSWTCECDCSRTCIVTGDNLRRGVVTSCGCRTAAAAKKRGKPENVAHVDYTGMTFGELTGVRRQGVDRWLWRCSCGLEKSVRASAVISGKVRSCGHVLSETARKKVLEDNVLGHVDGTSLSVIGGIVRGKRRSTNTSGATGVGIVKRGGKTLYRARITFQGKEHNLGTFESIESAKAARKEAEALYFGAALEKHDGSGKKSH